MENDNIQGLDLARQLYSERQYEQAIVSAEETLPRQENSRVKAEAHLLIGKCERSRGDLKAAICAANLAIQQYSKWKDPYLFRSACFQAFHSFLQQTDGDLEENIKKDRECADIIVDLSCTPTKVEDVDESEKMRILFRKKEKSQIYVNSLSDALRIVENGGKIFIEKGEYEVSSSDGYFLHSKSVSIIGSSSSHTILLYRCKPELVTDLEPTSKLETFLIASNSNTPTIIKRLTLRNENPSSVSTKLIGVAGGTVQMEDCIFDGLHGSGVDAVYANPLICGSFASSYPPPYVIIRFCIFDNCGGSGGITSLKSCINIKNSLFTGGGGESVSAQSSSKVSIENCELEVTGPGCSAVRSTSSDLTLTGSYIHGLEVGEGLSGACETAASVARISSNFFYRVGIGVDSSRTDLTATGNMFYSCTQSKSGFSNLSNQSQSQEKNDRAFHSAIRIRGGGKIQVSTNVVRSCDIGISLGEKTTPAIRDNIVSSSLFCGLFIETGAKPIVVGNILQGGEINSQGSSCGLGVLYLTGSGGTIGKNSFQDFCVSPLMVFTNCHPLLKDNRFDSVELVDERQVEVEKTVIHRFTHQVEQESYFYLVENSEREKALAPIILSQK